jgi:ABC-type antimicrobial peptide transport system permease subunit
MFFPLSQEIMNNETVLVVRSSLQSGELAAPLAQALEGVDPRIPYVLRSWSDALDIALFPARAAAAILSVMGLLAAMLAVTGIFGMATYGVSRRMKEFGIRIALGAARTQLMSNALGRTFVLILSGLAVGLVSGILSSRVLAQIVYQATAFDPIVLFGVTISMALLAVAATSIPARRALSIDPARLLRDE